MDRPWDLGIIELLMQHRSMPSTPQGQSPAKKFLGRHMHMSFELAALLSNEGDCLQPQCYTQKKPGPLSLAMKELDDQGLD